MRADEPPSQVAFSPAVALLSIGYVVGAIGLWYTQRDTPLGSAKAVVALFMLGACLFFVALWWARGLAPWRLRRESQVVALSSLAYLALFWEHGRLPHYDRWFGSTPIDAPLSPLYPFFFFAAASVLARVVLPLLTAGVLLRRGPLAYGYGAGHGKSVVWLYLLVLAFGVVAAALAARQPGFLSKYPLCKAAIVHHTLPLSTYLAYQLAYGLLFLSGEAFWRGYILFGLERELGRLALFFMVIPYVICHFGKPWPETLGAIVAGLVLGSLALAHRSFWWGVIVHWCIATTMDLLALWGRGVSLVP